jgi:kynurenine formamidase
MQRKFAGVIAGVAGIVLLAACSPARATLSGRVIDLTYAFDSTTIYWPTEKGFQLERGAGGVTPGGYYYVANRFWTPEHGGTHIDAPLHFAEGAQAVDEIPVERLIAPGIVIDVADASARDRDYRVTTDDFTAWEKAHGRIPDGSIVLLRTGYGRFWPDRQQYLGTTLRGDSAVRELHFPGLHPDAAQWLVGNRSINAIGLDTPSIDYGQSTGFESHVILYTHNIPAFENVANLDQLPVSGFTVIALPMKIRGGSGGPLRIVAVLP